MLIPTDFDIFVLHIGLILNFISLSTLVPIATGSICELWSERTVRASIPPSKSLCSPAKSNQTLSSEPLRPHDRLAPFGASAICHHRSD